MNGPEYVDLGLPSGTLWATCNIGASKMTEKGDFFAWGDISPKDNYERSTDPEPELSCEISIQNNNKDFVYALRSDYDAATHIMGEKWQMPSCEQAQELVNYCKWEWENNYENTRTNGLSGTSLINGNSIFFPAAGYARGSGIVLVGEYGSYWTRSLNFPDSRRARSITFSRYHRPYPPKEFYGEFRYFGFSIRSVFKQ